MLLWLLFLFGKWLRARDALDVAEGRALAAERLAPAKRVSAFSAEQGPRTADRTPPRKAAA